MPLAGLQSAKNRIVGTKQTLKAIEKGLTKTVFVAADAEARVTAPVVALCREKGITVVTVDSMKNLGKACNIEVGCAVAALPE
jgi:large subunit ribosomal protein L7A